MILFLVVIVHHPIQLKMLFQQDVIWILFLAIIPLEHSDIEVMEVHIILGDLKG